MHTARPTATGELLRHLESGQALGTAVFLDLSDLAYAGNPLFRRALVDMVDQFAQQYAPEIIDVGRYCQVFLFQDEAVRHFLDKLRAIETEFVDQHLSAPRVTAYTLPKDTRALAARLHQHDAGPAPSAPVGLSPAERQRLAAIHSLSEYEHILSGADLSAVVRESPVWRHDEDRWTVLYSEVTVALDSLERAVGVPLRHDPWLLEQIEPLLDRRIIRHFVTEPSRLRSPHSMNLRVASILERPFQAFMQALACEQRRNLIVEISVRDPDFASERLDDALDLLRLWECRTAIDHLTLRHDSPGAVSASAVDYLKVECKGLSGRDDAWEAALPAWMQPYVPDRVIGLCPVTDEDLAACLRLGFRMVERRTPPPMALLEGGELRHRNAHRRG